MRHVLIEKDSNFKYAKQYPFYNYLPVMGGNKRIRTHAYISKDNRIHFEDKSYPIKLVFVEDLKKSHVTKILKTNQPVYTIKRLR